MKRVNHCLCCGAIPVTLYKCADGRLYACCDLCARTCDLCGVRLQGATVVEETNENH